MRTISKMYHVSGGTNWKHKCKECKNLISHKKNKYCARYPGNGIWCENYVACKYFQGKNQEEDLQLSIFDVM